MTLKTALKEAAFSMFPVFIYHNTAHAKGMFMASFSCSVVISDVL